MKSIRTFARGDTLGEFSRFARALDLDPAALLAQVGMDARLVDNPGLVPAHAVVELFEITSITSGMDDFGLRLGEARAMPDHSSILSMLQAEATVRDALIAFLQLHSDAICLHLDESDHPIVAVNVITGYPQQSRQTIDVAVAMITRILRQLLGETWLPASVAFTHARPASRARYERFFRAPVHFSQEFNGIVLNRGDLDKPPVALPRRQAGKEGPSCGDNPVSSEAAVHQVMRLVAMALPRGEAKADRIARYIGTHRQGINRRLAGVELNFSEVVNLVRRELAVQYMLESDRPLLEVAGMVGFDSLRAFSRWFGQSFGSSPSSWRATNNKPATKTRQLST